MEFVKTTSRSVIVAAWRSVSGKLRCLGMAFLAFCAFGTVGLQAEPLNLQQGYPDLTASFITVNYDGTSGFTAFGYAVGLATSASPTTQYSISDIANPSYVIDMTVYPNGTFAGGTLNIYGPATINSVDYGDPLLTGNLSNFAFENSPNDPLGFIFTVTGGSLKSSYFPSQVGVLLNDWDTTPGSFTSDPFATKFSNDGNGTSDTFAVPEPSSLAASVALIFCALAYTRRRLVSRTCN